MQQMSSSVAGGNYCGFVSTSAKADVCQLSGRGNANYFPNDFDQLYTICDVRRTFILRDMQREFHERFHNKTSVSCCCDGSFVTEIQQSIPSGKRGLGSISLHSRGKNNVRFMYKRRAVNFLGNLSVFGVLTLQSGLGPRLPSVNQHARTDVEGRCVSKTALLPNLKAVPSSPSDIQIIWIWM